MNTSEVIGLGVAIVALAGLSVAIVYGRNTARILQAGGEAFTGSIRAATLQSGPTTKSH
jgi:hypothetical protein